MYYGVVGQRYGQLQKAANRQIQAVSEYVLLARQLGWSGRNGGQFSVLCPARRNVEHFGQIGAFAFLAGFPDCCLDELRTLELGSRMVV